MAGEDDKLLVGVGVGFNSIHSIVVRREAEKRLRLMGSHRYRKVGQEASQQHLIQRVRESINKAIEDAQVNLADIQTIGVALPGQIDIDNGIILSSPLFDTKEQQLREQSFPFVDNLRKYVNMTAITVMGNDDAQGIGEQRIGIGKGIEDLVYIHVGYIIGASIVIDKKLYNGIDHLAGELGHMMIDPHGSECDICGNKGCLNALASRSAMQKKLFKHHTVDKKLTLLANKLYEQPLDINSAIITSALEQEDSLTREVVVEAAEMLGIGIANVINFLNPQRVILGGDVIDEIELYFEIASQSAKDRALHANLRHVDIVRGTLGTTAAAYGAAVFAEERLKQATEISQTNPADR